MTFLRSGSFICLFLLVSTWPVVLTSAGSTAAAQLSGDGAGAAQQEPGTCPPGFVWREEFPGDKVCVTPQTRAQGAADNATADSRIKADGTCLEGFVWRMAGPNDHVCVPPFTRSQAAGDNASAFTRLAQPPPIPPKKAEKVYTDEDIKEVKPMVGMTPECNELAAKEIIYVVISAEGKFQAYHSEWSDSLKLLDFRGGLPGHEAVWVEQTGAAVARGSDTEFQAAGYEFRYTRLPLEPGENLGRYIIVARPMKYGRTGSRSFFLESQGFQLHVTTEDRGAASDDPQDPFSRNKVVHMECLPGSAPPPPEAPPSDQPR